MGKKRPWNGLNWVTVGNPSISVRLEPWDGWNHPRTAVFSSIFLLPFKNPVLQSEPSLIFPVFYCFYCNIVFQKLPWCQDHKVSIIPSFRSFHGAMCPSYHHDLWSGIVSYTYIPFSSISVGNPLEPYCCLYPYLYLSWYTLTCV